MVIVILTKTLYLIQRTNKNKNLMAYTITITNNSPQALAFVEYVKTLSFVKFTETQSKEKSLCQGKG